MSRATALARARTAAALGMTDTCTIRRRGAEAVDDNSGVVTPTWVDVYAGQCRVQQRIESSATAATPGEDHQLLVRIELQVPTSVTGVAVADEVTITASTDPELVGTVLIVRDLAAKSEASARRLGVTRRTS
jgi:hypothetical protein